MWSSYVWFTITFLPKKWINYSISNYVQLRIFANSKSNKLTIFPIYEIIRKSKDNIYKKNAKLFYLKAFFFQSVRKIQKIDVSHNKLTIFISRRISKVITNRSTTYLATIHNVIQCLYRYSSYLIIIWFHIY